MIIGTEVLKRNHAVVVCSVPLANILKRLPGRVRDFLGNNVGRIRSVFYRRYAEDNSPQLRAVRIWTKSQLLAVSWEYKGRKYTIGGYLGNALAPLEDPRHLIDQRTALVIFTELPEMDDESGGRRDDPLVPLEVRHYGPARYESLQEADTWYNRLKASVRGLDHENPLLRKLTVDVAEAGTQSPDVQREKLRPFARYVADEAGRLVAQDGSGAGTGDGAGGAGGLGVVMQAGGGGRRRGGGARRGAGGV